MLNTEESSVIKPTRTGFIRSLPVSMPIEEVIERGREIGLSINPSDVHSARYYMRQEAAKSATRAQAASTARKDTVDVAGTIRRNYQLLEAQRASDQSEDADDKAPVPAKRGKKSPAPPVGSQAFMRAAKQRSAAADADELSMAKALRTIVLRIGTERARAIIAELEALSIR